MMNVKIATIADSSDSRTINQEGRRYEGYEGKETQDHDFGQA
jgi:hypothetical protein